MRLGVLDVGSNTVHLLVVDAYQGARPVPAFSHKADCGKLASGNVVRTLRDAELAAPEISARRGPSRARIEDLDRAVEAAQVPSRTVSGLASTAPGAGTVLA
jgi:hypothetical protein